MSRSSIGARLASLGGATLLIAGLVGQAAPALAAAPARAQVSSWSHDSSSVAQGASRRVNVRALAGRRSSPLRYDPTKVSAELQAAEAVKPVARTRPASPDTVGPPDPDQVTSSGAPNATAAISVAGLTEASSGGLAPADPGIAVGPDEVLQVDNAAFELTDRAGNTLVTNTMDNFFGVTGGAVMTFEAGEPRAAFDTVQQRWIMTQLSYDCSTNTYTDDPAVFGHGLLDFAISDNADALGDWTVASFLFNDNLPDLPTFGSSTDKLALTSRLLAMKASSGPTSSDCLTSTSDGAQATVMDWTDLKPAFGSFGFRNNLYANLDALQVATQEPDTAADLRMIGKANGTGTDETAGDVVYIDVTGTVHTTVGETEYVDLTAAAIIPGFVDPPPPAQSGGTLTTSVDGSPDSVIASNGVLAFTATYPCTPTGDSSTRDCIRVTTLSNSPPSNVPSRLGDVLLGNNGFDSSFGGIAWSGNGVLEAVYTRSSTSSSASSVARYHLPGDGATAWSATQTLKASAGTFTGSDWGRYVQVAPDPQDPTAVWVGDPWANSSGDWSTTIHELVVGAAGAGYFPLDPIRVLDSRPSGSGVTNIGLTSALSANVPRTFHVTGVTVNAETVPSDAVAITGNLTVTQQTAAGFVSLTPTATASPSSSTLNFPVGDNRANNVTIALGPGGTLSVVYKASAGKHTHILLDVTGYFRAGIGQTYTPLSPDRVLDSRPGPDHVGTTTFVANASKSFPVAGVAIHGVTIPPTATAITANLTVTNQTKAGYVSLTPSLDTNPGSSTINFPVKDTRANGLTIPLSGSGSLFAVYKAASGAKVDLILDVTGYYSSTGGDGLLFHPLNPGRRIDTRLPLGGDPLHPGFGNGLSGAQGTTSRSAVIASHDGVPATAAAITGNLTVTAQTAAGYVSVTDALEVPPALKTSTINFPLGDNRANGITAPLGSGGALWFVYETLTSKHVQIILDITGYFQ